MTDSTASKLLKIIYNSNKIEDSLEAAALYAMQNIQAMNIELGSIDDPMYCHEAKAAFAKMWQDSIECDFRGRMVRAFPTFHLFLIDEGRKLKHLKLHDNFYGFSAIHSIDVVKSRKMVADMVTIQLSNIYSGIANGQIFVDDDGNGEVDDNENDWNNSDPNKDKPTLHWWTWVKSFAYPEFSDEQMKKRNRAYPSLMLREGSRLHLRIGYGSDASKLPIVFNGTITEYQVGDIINIIAQGDGIELCNKMPYTKETTNGLIGFGLEPRNIIGYMLNSRDKVSRIGNIIGLPGLGANVNPFGIVHFGDDKFTVGNYRPDAGEVCQNVYPGINSTSSLEYDGKIEEISFNPFNWFNDGNKKHGKDEIDLTIDLYDKTPWDVINTCAMAVPNYVAAVHPFGFRSTLFYGKPHYRLIYDYEYASAHDVAKDDTPSFAPWKALTEDYMFREVGKPFQQWHAINSYSDIIKSEIKASSIGVYNNVIGRYYAEPAPLLGTILNLHRDKPVERVVVAHADRDIWPQHQKTITVDTGIYCKGTRLLSWIPIVAAVWGTAHNFYTTSAVAMSVTQSTLRDYMKDMYQGQITMLGDPTIKPYDGIYLGDYYSEIYGVCEVEQVVHHMDIESGFITTIVPDAAVAVADPERFRIWSWAATAGMTATTWTAIALANGLIGTAYMMATEIAREISAVAAVRSVASTGANIGTGIGSSFVKWTSEVGSAKFAERLAKSAGGKLVSAGRKTLEISKGITSAAINTGKVGLGLVGTAAIAFLAYSSEIAIRRYMNLSQCLTIAPLMYKNKPFTAAMRGSKGLVIERLTILPTGNGLIMQYLV